MVIERARGLAVAAAMAMAVVSVATQSLPLSVTSADPRGELARLDDAGQVRIVFSQPMIALGTVPPGTAPPWIHITPAVSGSFYWSGTKTLIFSPDTSTPLPFATTFTVRVDATATSISGHSLGTPYVFRFMTPKVQLLGAEWYRRDGRFDRPAVIALRFNQPMRPDDVVAQTRITLEPHAWTAPVLAPTARKHLQRTDPASLKRFNDKIAAVRRVTSSSAAVGIRVADSWDEERFPASPRQIVVETTTAPPPDGWLRITMNVTAPSLDGPMRPEALSTVVKLEPTFFVQRMSCEVPWCTWWNNAIELTRSVTTDAFARALTIVDVTDPARQRTVTATRNVADRTTFIESPGVEDAGFDQQPPMHTWRLNLASELQASDGQTLGYPWVGFVEATHKEPFIALDGAVWEASGGPELPLNARNVQSITQWLAPVQPSSVVPRLRELEGRKPPPLPAGAETRPLPMTPDTVQTHGLDLSHLLAPRGTGLVWADLAVAKTLERYRPPAGTVYENVSPYAPPLTQRALLQITNLGISVKDSPQSTLVFVTRLDTGAPVPDARVAVMDAANQTRWRGTTDRDGVALTPALSLRGPRRNWGLSFVVTAEKDGDVAFVGSNWHSESPYYDRVGGDDEPDRLLRGSVFTDRGVYREREEVHLKAVLRDDTAIGIRTLPPDTPLDVSVRDSHDREVDRRRVLVNRWSSADWTWTVPGDATLGYYRVAVSPAGISPQDDDLRSVRGGFRVAAFRRPDFRVDAKLAGDPAVAGVTLRGTIEATYLFGGAFGARPVRWLFAGKAVQRPPDAVRERYPDARYAVGYMPEEDDRSDSASRSADGETLGPDGRASIAFPTTAEEGAAFTYTLEGDVEGVSGQHIANRASLVVHPASLYVAMSRPPVFVDTKTTTNVGIAAVDLAGRSAPGVAVTVSLLRDEWVSTRGSSGEQSVDWIRRQVPAGEWTVQTTESETPLSIAVREGGSYTLRATAHDAMGRQTRTELDFYALGGGLASWRSENNQIILVPERRTWKPGESARILIQSPWPQATALVTLEREGIRSHRTFTVTSTQDTVDVPITEADVPNVYVSVLLVKGRTSTELPVDGSDPGRPSYRVGYTELTVDDSSKRLSVNVASDRDEYRPRQPVKVSVAVAEPDGRPASSEVTLWAVDYGLLSLTAYTTPDLLKAIYVPKALQVTTEDNRQRLMGRRVMPTPSGLEAGVPGGVLGGVVDQAETSMSMVQVSASEGPEVADDEVRRDFRPLVFWLGSATTDASGRVTTTVTLPDSLTTYRIMAVAGNDASKFGFGEHEIRVTKPLTLLAAFPRFLSTGDRASFGAVVTNSGKTDGTAVVTVQNLDPDTLKFSAASQTVRLAAGASQSIKFDAVATGSGEARVRIAATLGDEADALLVPLTVGRPMRPATTAAYGDTVDTATERLALPPGVLRDAGGLTVELASTALVGLGESARYLDEYPYDCAEQKASRALALLLASDLGGAFKLSGIKPEDYRTAGTNALNGLSGYQCRNGGFALWAGQCGNESAYLTAYVLHVMKAAQTLQVAVDSNAVNRALDFLERELKEPPPATRWWPVWAASQAYSVKVLAEFGRTPRATITQLVGMADRLPVFALSYLADALAATGDRGPRYSTVVRSLTNALRIEADRAHVEEKDDDTLAWLWNTNARATAVVLDGLSRRGDGATLVAPLVRWLVGARVNGRWGTTHENAMALEALVAYYRAFEKEVPRMTTAVEVGSTTVGTATFNDRSTAAQQIQLSMPDLLKHVAAATSPALSISRNGTGRVYYTARVQYFVPESPEAVDRGVRVERRYEPYVTEGVSRATTSFNAGDLIRVTVAVTVRGEGRYLALTDPLPAGFEPLEDWSLTTASDLAREATRTGTGDDWLSWWRGGYFDHVEKHDDHVLAFATRLGSGRHEFSYLVRATTAGTFDAPGARVEAMYSPEFAGRSQAATVTVR